VTRVSATVRRLRLWRSRVTTVLAAFRVFSTPADALRFLRLKRAGDAGGPPVSLRPRALGGLPVRVRPGTTDAETLWNTFFHRYHLPPPNLPEPRVIVDLGANAGYTCCHFAALYPEARIVALELDGANHELAVANTAPFRDRCTVEHGAAWSADGRVPYSGERADAFRVVPGADDTEPRERSVRAWSLDSLFDRFDLTRVDYLKMDVEGAEEPILESAGPWLDRVAALGVELHGDFTPARAIARLEARGFRAREDRRHWASVVAWRESACP
jgi:FkbM family methyltransferase